MQTPLLKHLIPNVGTVVVVAFMLFAYTAWAAPLSQTSVPGVITYQGTLTDDAGQPINSSVEMTFRLYSTDSGGTALWTETHTGVPVQGGLFRVGLGRQTPIPTTVWDNVPLYLGIQIGSEAEMSPREELGAAPFAIQSQVALTVPDGSITPEKAPELISAVKNNTYVQYDRVRVNIDSTTDRVAYTVDFEDYQETPMFFAQPWWNYTEHVIAVLASPCDKTQCRVALQRTDGKNWGAGKSVDFHWLVIGPR